MGSSENRVARVIWRALNRHIRAGHKFEIRRLPRSGDLEIHCCWCGGTVMAGSPQLVRRIAAESGARIVGEAPSVTVAA